MRPHVCLLLACLALTRASPISDDKLADIQLDPRPLQSYPNAPEIPDYQSIKDVGNQLRTKPEDIPVEILEQDQLALKAAANEKQEEEIVRPEPDLKNPGEPQRQEHETQNPTFYSAEQNNVNSFKQTIIETQTFLRDGFQDVADAINGNEQVQAVQASIQSLQQGFIDQLNKLNGTVQNLYASGIEAIGGPEQIQSTVLNIESGINRLKSNFNKDIETFSEGVKKAANLRDDNQAPTGSKPSGGSTTQASTNIFQQLLNSFQQSYNNYLSPALNNSTATPGFQGLPDWFSWFGGSASTPPTIVAQSDSPIAQNNVPAQADAAPPAVPTTQRPVGPLQVLSDAFSNVLPQPAPGSFGSGSGPIVQFGQAVQSAVTGAVNSFRPQQSASVKPEKPADQKPTQAPPAKPSSPEAEKPASEEKPADKPADISADKPAETLADKPADKPSEPQAAAVTPAGPIRQILQNNPISKGIASAVQRLQNIRNPEKPREEEIPAEEQPVAQALQSEEKPEPETKGGFYRPGGNHSGDNIDLSGSGIEEAKEKAPELKAEQTVVEKTE